MQATEASERTSVTATRLDEKKGKEMVTAWAPMLYQPGGAQRPHLKMMFLNEFDKVLKITKEVDSIKI